MHSRPLGRSGLSVSAIAAGTNRWGATDVRDEDAFATYRAMRRAGVDFFDSAEMYNHGGSERVIGACAKSDAGVILASKFAPLPHRVTARQFDAALDSTLARLGRETVDLYYLHFPYSLLGVRSWMEHMARAVHQKKVRAVGISNCSASQTRVAVDTLGRFGIALAANQVHYSIRHRAPESNGVLAACRELDVALVAYRPLDAGPADDALARALSDVARKRGATVKQVSLAWLLRHDHVIAIPGTTNPAHAEENAHTLTLEPEDLEQIGRTLS